VAVSGGGAVQVFSVSAAVTATISDLTIEHGNAGNGSNGTNDNVTVPASNSTVYPDGGDAGNNGGGIANSGILTLKDDVVAGNTAGAGGVGGSGSISVSGNTETAVIGDGGSGGAGGGIYNSGTLTLIDDTVSGNTTGHGGSLHLVSATRSTSVWAAPAVVEGASRMLRVRRRHHGRRRLQPGQRRDMRTRRGHRQKRPQPAAGIAGIKRWTHGHARAGSDEPVD
jgi:hypothetical protein